jgi:hypothetical protein
VKKPGTGLSMMLPMSPGEGTPEGEALSLGGNGRNDSHCLIEAVGVHGCCPCRLTAYEFSGNTRANARVLPAATRG